jgi:hypothetical protein
MRFTRRPALLALALIFSGLRCPYLEAQEPTPPTAPAATQDIPPPRPGEVVRPWQPGDPEPKGPLQIVVIDGQDGINILKKKRAVQPVVEVRDGRNTPISGASVTFSSPTNGPSLLFSNGLRSISVLTDATGRATVDDLKPLSLGQFQITVESSFRSLSATATISLTNVLRAAPNPDASTRAAKGSGMSGKTIAILVGVAVAAAAGIGVGLAGHGSSSSSSSTSTTATIGTGSGGSVGAPH